MFLKDLDRLGGQADGPARESRLGIATSADRPPHAVKPTYKDGWDIPGGYVEPGETPVAACEREIKEELNLDRKVHRLLVVDWAPSQAEGDKVLFVFDGGELTEEELAAIVLPADELQASEFHDPTNIHELMPARLARRIRASVEARGNQTTRYLEHGAPVRGAF